MARWKEYILIIFLGVGIGLAVPYVTYSFPQQGQGWEGQSQEGQDSEDQAWAEPMAEAEAELELEGYHCTIEAGLLSVVEGGLRENGRVVFAGLDVQDWPAVLKTLATSVEFASLDEVQSFIDTVSESK